MARANGIGINFFQRWFGMGKYLRLKLGAIVGTREETLIKLGVADW